MKAFVLTELSAESVQMILVTSNMFTHCCREKQVVFQMTMNHATSPI